MHLFGRVGRGMLLRLPVSVAQLRPPERERGRFSGGLVAAWVGSGVCWPHDQVNGFYGFIGRVFVALQGAAHEDAQARSDAFAYLPIYGGGLTQLLGNLYGNFL